MPAGANVVFTPPGLLVFRSGGRLLAQAFDWKQPRLGGEAVQLSDSVGGSGTQSRFTFDPADDMNPTWSPDGSRIAFSSAREGQRDVYVKAANGIGEEQLLFGSAADKNMECWSLDGRLLLFNTTAAQGQQQIWALPLKGERKPYAVLSGPEGMQASSLSSDGKFVTYWSNESGRSEVFLQSFPPGHDRWQVSTMGGSSPQWRADGKELFYVQRGRLMAADVTVTGARLAAGVPRELFQAPFSTAGRNLFVPSRDGEKFLAVVRVEEVRSPSITVELNWMSRMKK